MKNNSALRIVNRYVSNYKMELCLAYTLIMISTLIDLCFPLLVQEATDNIGNLSTKIIVSIVAVLVIILILESIAKYRFSVVGQKTVRDIRIDIWNRLIRTNIEYVEKNVSGELSSRLINDSSILIHFVSSEVPDMIVGVVSIIGTLVIMFRLDIVMTVVFLCLIPIVAVTIKPISNQTYQLSEEIQNLTAISNGYFSEMFAHIKLIKAYQSEEIEILNGSMELNKLCECGNRNSRIQAMLMPLMGTIMTGMLIGVGGLGLYRMETGKISVGVLVAFVLYFLQVVQPIQNIGTFLVEIQAVKGATKKLMELYDLRTEQVCTSDGIRHPSEMSNNNIKFENVCFGYGNGDLFQNLSFEIKSGTTVALIGESGSGKTTIMSLMEGFYKIRSGKILYGDQNLEEMSLYERRALFSYVFQENSIITGTLKENIIYGIQREVPENEIHEILCQMHMDTFVDGLPCKLDTIVGERGELLSGGQKQRISIARAILRNAPILLLDEATANLDAESEMLVNEAISKSMKGKTTVVIAHKLSTVIGADAIVVMKNGGIIDCGKHDELIARCEYYKMLLRRQFPDYEKRREE